MGLSYSRWTNKNKGTYRTIRVVYAYPCPTNSLRNLSNSILLTNYCCFKRVFHIQKLLSFISCYLLDFHTANHRNYICNILLRNIGIVILYIFFPDLVSDLNYIINLIYFCFKSFSFFKLSFFYTFSFLSL